MKVRAEIDFDILNAFCIDDFDGNKYLIGCGFTHNESHIVLDNGDQYPIKKDTRAVHFEDMIDSNSKAIFASLSEDGKGGDILKTRGNEAPCKFNKGFTIETIMGISNLYMLLDKVKVIGIQE